MISMNLNLFQEGFIMKKILIAVICLMVLSPAVNAGLKDDFAKFLKTPQGAGAVKLVSKIDLESIFDKTKMSYDGGKLKLDPEQIKKLDDAIAECDKTLAEDPKSATAAALKALFLLMQGKMQNAMDFVSRITVYQQDADYAWLIQSALLLAQNNLVDARWSVENAMAINPESPIALFLNGGIYYLEKKYDSAILNFEEAGEIEPDLRSAADMAGAFAYYAMENHEEVLACLERLKTESAATSNYLYWAIKGECLSKMDYDREAQAAFDKALKLNRADMATWKNKADSLRKLEKEEEASGCDTMVNALQKAADEKAKKEKEKDAVVAGI